MWNKHLFSYVNHARIHSWNQPVLSNSSKGLFTRKQRGPWMRLELTTDRYPPTRYPLRQAAYYLGNIVVILILHYKPVVFNLNFIYCTTIKKQAKQLILIMLVGTDVCVRVVFVLEETKYPEKNTRLTWWPNGCL